MTTNSFTHLLNTGDYQLIPAVADRLPGIPKFKSTPPPSLPISPSSSSYFSIPHGLSPTDLLDSPVLLSSSNILPSPTTGTFAAQGFDWKSILGANQNSHPPRSSVKQEHSRTCSDFTFQTQANAPSSKQQQQQQEEAVPPQLPWSFQDQIKQIAGPSSVKNPTVENQGNIEHQRKSDDGYNWRKYGQKQVKGSENPRSYYKCTYPGCPTKKKVEKSLDGQITEIVYKGGHNHAKPQNTRRSSSHSQSIQPSLPPNPINDIQDSFQVATPDNSSISLVDDDLDRASSDHKSSTRSAADEDEPEPKRRKAEAENECMSAAPGSRTVREPRVVVQTPSDIDILDDGYRWRKYGQKVVKGNPNPRSYYKCTYPGCPVRKHVERASNDLRSVITTYEGKHNHDVPAARGSQARGLLPQSQPLALSSCPPHQCSSSMQGPGTSFMLHTPPNLGFSGFGASSYANPRQNVEYDTNHLHLLRAKEEPRDDIVYDSFLC